MKTLIKIITVTWPLVKEGVIGKYQVSAYISRRKFSSFLFIIAVALFLALSFMTEQAHYHRKEHIVVSERLSILQTKYESLEKENIRNNRKAIVYSNELIRLNKIYDIESPLIIKDDVKVKDDVD